MEKLKLLVPEDLKNMVANSTPDNLHSTSSSLLELFLQQQLFHEMVRDLADTKAISCGKDKDAALELKQQGNQYHLRGEQNKALSCYSKALRAAPVDANNMDKNLSATLYLNRASTLHKIGLLMECIRDCNRALQISPCYAKAWFRRGKINASLGKYEDAVRDFTIAKSMESSLGGKRQIEKELEIIVDHHRKISSTMVQPDLRNLDFLDASVRDQIKLQCEETPHKGRGMISEFDIPQASLVHTEEPYAVIILKHCRETHCHYCLNELPADMVPCPSCTISLYCSDHCKVQAGGQVIKNVPKEHDTHEMLSGDLVEYMETITSGNNSYPETKCWHEHQHECQGVNWPAVLPSDVVLAGRILIKSIEQGRVSLKVPYLKETLDLSHSYTEMQPESKLQLHIYSIVLLWCLRQSYSSELPLNGAFVSQIVILLSQIKVNSMAIVCMKSSDVYLPPNQSKKSSSNKGVQTTSVEQVKVGQAIYTAGSLFNHSCQPNIHAYFHSRKLLLRTTEFVPAGCPLEMSYGPEVGKWDSKDRIRFLENEYFFQCQCRGCSEVNMSDLVLNGFHCPNLNCSGVVLDSSAVRFEEQKQISFQVGRTVEADIKNIAQHVLNKEVKPSSINPGRCLKCASYCDMQTYHLAVEKARINIRRLQDSLISIHISVAAISDAMRSLNMLKSTLHAYNKSIAEVEDIVAQAFCLVGDLDAAKKHCKASIQVLEKLYGSNHIVIGYELLKLSSLQLSSGDHDATDNINRLCLIFSRYYGSHVDVMFPELQYLKKEASNFLC